MQIELNKTLANDDGTRGDVEENQWFCKRIKWPLINFYATTADLKIDRVSWTWKQVQEIYNILKVVPLPATHVIF